MCWLVAAVLALPVCVSAQTADSSRVIDVLKRFEARGYTFLYSTATVNAQMRFPVEPDGLDNTDQLASALAGLGLRLIQDDPQKFRIVAAAGQPRSAAQPLVGRVYDAESGQPIAGAVVQLGSATVITDEHGRFQLPSFTGAMSVQHEGYVAREIAPGSAVQTLLTVSLKPESRLEDMVVVSSRYALKDRRTRSRALDLELFDSVPRLAEDPIRLASHLPGMASIGVSAKPHIRGGLQDEVLVLFNNLELLEPFHLRDFQSVFSSFDPSVIKTIDVYTGGFPARYGDRMSGVMDISTDKPTEVSRGELGLSFFNTSLLLHGQSDDANLDWVTSVRRGNLDVVTRKVNSSVGEPSYSDAYGQLRFGLDERSELDVGFIAYNDDIRLSDFDEDGEIASSRYRNLYGWVQLHRNWTNHLEGSTLLYAGSVRHDRQGFLSDEDLDNGQAEVMDERDFSLISLNQILRYSMGGRFSAEFGARLVSVRGRYNYDGLIQRGVLADILDNQVDETRRERLRPDGTSGGLFGSVKGEFADGLSVELGLRWDYQAYGLGSDDNYLSPRLSVRWQTSEDTEFRVSTGRFYQPEAVHELQVGDGLTRYQPAQYADQLIASWYQGLPGSLTLRTEAFYKWIRDPKVRYENLLNPLVLLPELASDRVEVAAQRARAYGVETTLQYQPDEKLMAWGSLSYSRVEDRIEGSWQPRIWDQGPTLSAGLSYEGERWRVGATLLWHAGWRTTTLPQMVAADSSVPLQRNQSRLKDYFSLDLQIARTWRWQRQKLTAVLELTNVLARRNVGGVEFDVEELEDESGYLLTPTEEHLIPLVPSIGVRWSF